MTRRFVFVIALATAALVAAPAPESAAAQELPQSTAGAEAMSQPEALAAPTVMQDDFRAVQQRQAQSRTMRGYWHLFIAFAVTWLLLFGYAISLGRRFGKLERELERVTP